MKDEREVMAGCYAGLATVAQEMVLACRFNPTYGRFFWYIPQRSQPPYEQCLFISLSPSFLLFRTLLPPNFGILAGIRSATQSVFDPLQNKFVRPKVRDLLYFSVHSSQHPAPWSYVVKPYFSRAAMHSIYLFIFSIDRYAS